MSRLTDVVNAVKANPLIAFAMFPPWGFTRTMREWAAATLDQQMAENNLRAVAGAETDKALQMVDEQIAFVKPYYEMKGYDTRNLRNETLRVLTSYYAKNGTLP